MSVGILWCVFDESGRCLGLSTGTGTGTGTARSGRDVELGMEWEVELEIELEIELETRGVEFVTTSVCQMIAIGESSL